MLKYWLPLCGDLHNQGLDEVVVTNNGATANDNGKIGKCYYFDGNAHWLQLDRPLGDFYNNDFSLAVWLKPTDSTRSIILSEYSASGASNVAFELTTARVIRVYWNGSPDINATAAGGLTLNEWSHIAIVKTNGVIKFYINGVLKYTYTGTLSTRTSNANPRIGDDYRGGTSVSNQGKKNDFRLYSHALSPKEVKELSKGLVLHYPLNRGGFGCDNIIAGSSSIEKQYTYPASGYKDWYSPTTTVIPTSTQYTLSFYAKSTVNGDKIRTHFYSPNTTTTCISSQGITKTASDGNMDFTLSTEWKRYWVIYTQTETTAVKHVICPRLVSGQGTGTVSMKCVKLEEGSTPTPWVPNSTDALYSKMGLNNGIIYDVSGNNYNGTSYNSFASISDTPRYKTAIIKTDSTKPVASIPVIYKNGATVDEITLSCWWKTTTADGNTKNLICLGGNNFIRYGMSSTTNLWVYTKEGITASFTTSNIADNKWHMYTVTFKDGIFKGYLDGSLLGSVDKSSSRTALPVNSEINYIGAYGVSSEIVPGSFSDVRVYSTALSGTDILALYNTPISLTSNGTLMTSGEYTEV